MPWLGGVDVLEREGLWLEDSANYDIPTLAHISPAKHYADECANYLIETLAEINRKNTSHQQDDSQT